MSFEELSEEENELLWAEEARRSDGDLDAAPDQGRPADEVFREARSKLQ